MLVITVVTLMAVAVIGLFPETGVARLLRRWLVEGPARWLNRAAVWRVAFFGGLVTVGVAMTVLFEVEGLLVYGMMAPEIVVWATLFDIGLMIDAFLITAAVLASNGLKVASLRARTLSDRVMCTLRKRLSGKARRVRVARRPAREASDDDEPAWAQPPYRPFSIA